LDSLERHHPTYQQVDDKRFQAHAILQRTGHIGWKSILVDGLTVRASFDLGIHMFYYFFKSNCIYK
jgi:hypothetical protein